MADVLIPQPVLVSYQSAVEGHMTHEQAMAAELRNVACLLDPSMADEASLLEARVRLVTLADLVLAQGPTLLGQGQLAALRAEVAQLADSIPTDEDSGRRGPMTIDFSSQVYDLGRRMPSYTCWSIDRAIGVVKQSDLPPDEVSRVSSALEELRADNEKLREVASGALELCDALLAGMKEEGDRADLAEDRLAMLGVALSRLGTTK